jgi:hypothetical protein
VDVIVTNPDGQADTLAGGYTYAAAEAFGFGGARSGFVIGPAHAATLAWGLRAAPDETNSRPPATPR